MLGRFTLRACDLEQLQRRLGEAGQFRLALVDVVSVLGEFRGFRIGLDELAVLVHPHAADVDGIGIGLGRVVDNRT